MTKKLSTRNRKITRQVSGRRLIQKSGTGATSVLLESFGKKFAIMRQFGIFNPEGLGQDAARSFIVDLKMILARADEPKVEIPFVGALIWSSEKKWIDFEPDKSAFTETAVNLDDFLQKLTGQRIMAGDLAWKQVFRTDEEPFSGLDLLARVATWLLPWIRSKEDSTLMEELRQAMGLAVHDAICCRSGIELETVGMFTSGPKFLPDASLVASIGAMRSKNRGTRNLKFTRIKVGPRPE